MGDRQRDGTSEAAGAPGSAVVLDMPTSTGVPGATTQPGPPDLHALRLDDDGRPSTSNACVELPVPTPQRVYATLQLGDLVIVRAASAPGPRRG